MFAAVSLLALVATGTPPRPPQLVQMVRNWTPLCQGVVVGPSVALVPAPCLRTKPHRIEEGPNAPIPGKSHRLVEWRAHPGYQPPEGGVQAGMVVVSPPFTSAPVALAVDPPTVGEGLAVYLHPPPSHERDSPTIVQAAVVSVAGDRLVLRGAVPPPCQVPGRTGPALAQASGVTRLVGLGCTTSPDCSHLICDRVDGDLGRFVSQFVASHQRVGGGLGRRCAHDSDCAEGVCLRGEEGDRQYCSRPCGPGCPDGTTCRHGRCWPTTPAPGGLGDTCSRHTDCEELLCARVAGATQGRCSYPCQESRTCPDGLRCEPVEVDFAPRACVAMRVPLAGCSSGGRVEDGPSLAGLALGGLLLLAIRSRRQRKAGGEGRL